MELTWFGHSCFLLKNRNGKKLLTDPFDDSLGYSVPNEAVDIVTVSHHHFDHDNTAALPGIPDIIDQAGTYDFGDINIKGISSYHDNCFGAKRGNNIIFVIKIDGYSVCHLGDLGHSLSPKTISEIGEIDILLIPVGGNYTIDGEEASKIARSIKSHIIIPMHYGTAALSFPLEGAEKFIMKMGNSDKVASHTLIVDHISNELNNVKVLKYKT